MNADMAYFKVELNILVERLFQITTSKQIETRVELVFKGQDPTDSNGYIYASEFLKDHHAILNFEELSKWTEDNKSIDSRNGLRGGPPIYYFKFRYTFNSKQLREFLEDSDIVPVYTLTYDFKRRLIVNNKYILTTLDLNGINDNFIAHAFKKAGKTILRTEIKDLKNTKKRFHTIAEQLIRDPEIKRMFFPAISNLAIEFRDKIYNSNIHKMDISLESINKRLKKFKTIVS